MSTLPRAVVAPIRTLTQQQSAHRALTPWELALRSGRVLVGGGIVAMIFFVCLATLPATLDRDSPLYYDRQANTHVRNEPVVMSSPSWFGHDDFGRSLFARCLLGGAISLSVGVAAATISVVLGVSVGLIAGYRGGWIDSMLMRSVDVLYGLPYILLVVLFKVAFEGRIQDLLNWIKARLAWEFETAMLANLIVLFLAIGLVSWLTMARVVRGQVLSLRGQPFIEACRAMGLPRWRIFIRHILPNLVGPITVYATLIVPQAILQESFLSFLGVGVNPPLPTWGALASDAVKKLNPVQFYWWMLTFPCMLLVVTLLALNFLGDGLRDVFDPKRDSAKL